MRIKIIAAAIACGCCVAVAGCSSQSGGDLNSSAESAGDTQSVETTESEASSDAGTSEASSENGGTSSSESSDTFNQLSEPQSGDVMVTITIQDKGDMVFRLFSDKAPVAVENFVNLANSGYYNGVTFHRIIEDFMIQGGDPTATGSGGESYTGESFDDEISQDLVPIRGSLCMAENSLDEKTSQFFIVSCTDKLTGSELLDYINSDSVDDAVKTAYKGISQTARQNLEDYGGAYWLYGTYTVFGQMESGYELLDELDSVETDSDDKPVEDVVIQSVTVSEY